MQQPGAAPSMSTATVLRLLTVAAAVGMAATIYLPWIGYPSGYSLDDIKLYDLAFDGDYNRGMLTSTGVMLAALVGVLLSSVAGGTSGRAEAGWARARGAFFGAALLPAVDMFFTDKIIGLQGVELKAGVWLCMVAAGIGIGLAAVSVLMAEMNDDDHPASHASGIFSGAAFGIIITLYGLVLLELAQQFSSSFLTDPSSDRAEAYKLVLSDAGVAAAAGAVPTIFWLLRLMSRASAYPAYGGAPAYGRPAPAPYGPAYHNSPAPSTPAPAAYAAAGVAPSAVESAPVLHVAGGAEAPPSAPALDPPPAPQPAAPDATLIAPAATAPRAVRARYNGVVVWQDWRRRDVQIERVAAGTPMTVLGEAEGFFDVQLASGVRGFVAVGAVEPAR